MVTAPIRVRVRMYQVGFGDCFLVSLEYAAPLPDGRAERHILIDFGSSHAPRRGSWDGGLTGVAKLIQAHTGGVLDALIVTHRHEDHVSGFGDATAAAIIRALAPKRVVRPWTDEPMDAAKAAPAAGSARKRSSKEKAEQEAIAYAALLNSAQRELAPIAELRTLDSDVRDEARGQLEDSAAELTLGALGGEGRGRFVAAGDPLDLDEIVPGLESEVLGPVRSVAQDDGDDRTAFHRGRASDVVASLRDATTTADGDKRSMKLGPGPVRWLVDRLVLQRSHSVARLVRDVDEAINDTSLILLLRIDGVSMLFAGDAQIEGWAPILRRARGHADLRTALAHVDLYKVGHHGSRNATPRSLHALWSERDESTPALTSLLSTRSGVLGGTAATAVPRETLVTALAEVSTLYSTDELEGTERFVELVADAARGPFRRVE